METWYPARDWTTAPVTNLGSLLDGFGFEGAPKDKYELAERIALAGLDGFEGRLSAKNQREIFGKVLYGKKYIKIDCSGQGCIQGQFRAAITGDVIPFEDNFERVIRAIKTNYMSF